MNTIQRFCISVVMAVTMLNSTVYSQWTPQTTNLPETAIVTILSAVSQRAAWGIAFARNYAYALRAFVRTTNGGKTWTTGTIPTVPNFTNTALYALTDSVAWITMRDVTYDSTGGVFKTTDAGATWIQQKTAFPGAGGFINFIFFFDANDGICGGDLNVDYFEIYTTKDGGDNWVRVPRANIPEPLGEHEWGFVNHYAASGDSTLWFGTSMGRVFKTTNRGITWNAYSVGWEWEVVSVAFQNTNTGLAITSRATANGKIAKTTDGGMTWTTFSMPPPITGPIDYVPGSDNSYVITSGFVKEAQYGSAYTVNGGENWTIADSVGHGDASFVDVYTGWSASTTANVVYKWEGPPFTSVEESFDNLPRQTALHQNYPNPFNPETTIGFSLQKASHVELTIYNILGQEIRNLDFKNYPSGEHRVKWDGRDDLGRIVNSGIYLFRIKAGDFADMRKMIFMK